MGWNPVQRALFVNPYNFVPLGKKPTRLKDGEVTAEKKHTGWLDCKLITKTPLIIPDTETPLIIPDTETPLIIPDTEKMTMDKNCSEHKKYEFLQLKVNDGFVPAVPGSQIRGVVRNIYETITDSCMGTSKNTVLSHRALEFANPGVLKYENEKWVLYKAERYRICTAKTRLWNKKTENWVEPLYSMNDEGRIKVGEKYFGNCSQVSFKYHTLTKNSIRLKNVKGLKLKNIKGIRLKNIKGLRLKNSKGLKLKYVDQIYCSENEANNETNVKSGFLLMIPEAKTGKIYDSIMKPLDQKVNCCNLDAAVNTIEEIWKSYIHNVKNNPKRALLYEKLMFKARKEGTPIWYQSDRNGQVHFSVAQRGRQIMKNTMYDILGEFAPCQGQSLCPACRLFGTINGCAPRVGKVRFSDAMMTKKIGETVFEWIEPLEELASPHITAFEFYMKKPAGNPPTWTYDFYRDGDRPKNIINGRKFYWHFMPKKNEVSKTNRNATMEAAINGTEFAFKVYFNDITSDELEILKTAITLGENKPNSNLCHKLGHGKPLGYGSVKLTIEGQTERTLAFSKELGEIQYRTGHTKHINVKCIDAQNNPSLLKIVDLTTIKEGVNVCYPLGEDNTAENQNLRSGPLQWFIGNKGGFANNPNIKMILPKISDKKITLPKLRKT